MSETLEKRELAQVLISLEANRDAVPWAQRRTLAASLAKELTKPGRRDTTIRIVQYLADDPKWEVRKEIAFLLPSLPDDEFAPLAAKLTQDSNSFVRKAAQRALDLRRNGFQEFGGRRRGLEHVIAQFDMVGATQGPAVSDKLRALAVRLFEVSVAATVHDLRGVLTSAKTNLTRLQSEATNMPVDGKAIREGLDKVANRLVYLEKFVDAMGTYAQSVPPERAAERLSQIVRDAHGMAVDAVHSARFDTSRVEASISVDDNLFVLVAKHQVVVAISNVLKNAYEAVLLDGGRSGRVSIEVKCVGNGEGCILIHDNGVGMSADDLRELRAFVPGRTTKKGYGTGFGLPIAHRNIADHGGSISIDSTEDAGTEVTIFLPITSPGAPDE